MFLCADVSQYYMLMFTAYCIWKSRFINTKDAWKTANCKLCLNYELYPFQKIVDFKLKASGLGERRQVYLDCNRQNFFNAPGPVVRN